MRSYFDLAMHFLIWAFAIALVAATKDKSTVSNHPIKQEPISPSSSESSSPISVPHLQTAHSKASPVVKADINAESSPSPHVAKVGRVRPHLKAMKIPGRGHYSHAEREARDAIRKMNIVKLSDRKEKKIKKEEQ